MPEKTILLVEDNPDDESLTLRAFRKHIIANRVVVVRDGIEALDYLFGAGACEGNVDDLPHVVLLDLKLPRLDGLGVLRRIRNNDRTRLLPVVVFTSSKEEQDVIRGYQLGANSYVRKPVNFEEMMTVALQLHLY